VRETDGVYLPPLDEASRCPPSRIAAVLSHSAVLIRSGLYE
jgi:hypothetical protein